MAWALASDIALRLKELLAIYGWQQQQMAKRAGVRPAQVGVWLRGVQAPARVRLETWAEREGWPRAIFEDGGPMPSAVVNRPVQPRSADGRGPVPQREADRYLAAQVEEAEARVDELLEQGEMTPRAAALVLGQWRLALRKVLSSRAAASPPPPARNAPESPAAPPSTGDRAPPAE